MPYRNERRREVFDLNKRSWNKNNDAGGDADVFYTEYVVPLRRLQSEGLFEKLIKLRGSYRGSTKIDRVDIKGAINYEAGSIGNEDAEF